MTGLYFLLIVYIICGIVFLLLPVTEKVAQVQDKRQKVDMATLYKRPYDPNGYATYQIFLDGSWNTCSRTAWHALKIGQTYRFRIRNKRIVSFEVLS